MANAKVEAARERVRRYAERNAATASRPVSLTPMGFIDLQGRYELPRDRFGAMMSSDFIACETAKIRAIRSLPVSVLKETDNGPAKAPYHPLAKALRRPNPLMSWGDLLAWAILRRDVFGTAYIRVQRDQLYRVKNLWPVTANVTAYLDKATGAAAYSAPMDAFNDPWTSTEDGVVVLKTDVSDDGGITGKSLAEAAAADIGLSIELSEFYRSVLQNGTHMGGWLESPDKLGPDDIAAIRRSLDSMAGAEGAGGIRVFDRGLKFHEVSMAVADLSIIDQERFVLEKVCRACHVDLHHVYADGGTSATGSEGYDIDFVKNTVLPDITAMEDAFIPVLDAGGGVQARQSRYRVDFDTNGLLRGDFKTRMDGYRIGVYAGIFTRAWCCEQEGIAWLPGQDKLLQPTAYDMVGTDGEPYSPHDRGAQPSGQSDGVSGIDEKDTATAEDQ